MNNLLEVQSKLEEIQQLLTKSTTKPSTDSKQVVITDQERREIERLIAKNITTGQDLIASLIRLASVNVDGATLSLEPRLLERLQSRCIGMSFDKFLELTIKRLLEEYAGLR